MTHRAFGWQTDRSLEDWLYAEPYRFEFYQAVRLLESFRPRALITAGSREADPPAVRFRSRVAFGFPASEVQEIEFSDGRPSMTVNFLGLAGAFGPLPAPYSEMILAALARKDYAAAAFLDIFNNRLVGLFYRARQAHFPALTARAPHEGKVAQYLFSLIGLGIPAMRDVSGTAAASGWPAPLLHYSGLLAKMPRTAAGLERMLADHLAVPVRIRQFVGGWRSLDRSQWTSIGARGSNCVLGAGMVLGRRVWDDSKSISVTIGPVSLRLFREFLPGGARYRVLAALVKFYLGGEQDAEVQLILNAAEVPHSSFGQSLLGRTSWLFRRNYQGANPSVRINVKHATADATPHNGGR
jgi:type VI secretion system protein ImpH